MALQVQVLNNNVHSAGNFLMVLQGETTSGHGRENVALSPSNTFVWGKVGVETCQELLDFELHQLYQ